MSSMISQSDSSRLLDLASELLHQVLVYLPPKDVVQFGQTCKTANNFVSSSNQSLWKEVFLNRFDDPRPAWADLLPTARALNLQVEAEWDWHLETLKRYKAFQAIAATEPVDRNADYENNIATLIQMIETAKRKSIDASDDASLNVSFIIKAFESSINSELFIHDFHPDHDSPSVPLRSVVSTIGRPLTRSMLANQSVSELASRFHILHGLTFRERYSSSSKGMARSLVYDWFLSGPYADYGPYQSNGTGQINWTLLEAIYSVIVRNFELVTDSRVHFPQGFQHNVPIYRGLTKLEDWAGVESSWLGTYAFLDYTDLFNYNIANRPGFRPPLDEHVEACGDVMRLDLKIDPTQSQDQKLFTRLPFCRDLPPLFFSGVSRGHESTHNANAAIAVRGFCALTPGGRHVRWRFIIHYGGNDQWQLEGVQPGGPRTGGVFGLWSHCDHEANGPLGPFCYYPMNMCPPCPMAQHVNT